MLLRVLVAFGVVAVSLVAALAWRRREGRFTETGGRFDRAELGLTGRAHAAVLVEFFGEHCAPCVTVQNRISKLAQEIPDVAVVSVDAGARLDLAERYGVKRVPTLFVADENLHISWRASGVPSEDAIRGALLGPDWAGRPNGEVPIK